MSEKLYYIQDTRQIVGNCPMFYKHNNNGYTSNLDEAMVVGEKEAVRMVEMRDSDRAWEFTYLNGLARRTIDVQNWKKTKENCILSEGYESDKSK